MNKFQQSLIVAALLGNLSFKEVKAMGLQAKNASAAKVNAEDYDFDWGTEEESVGESVNEFFESTSEDLFDDGESDSSLDAQMAYRGCRSRSKPCSCNSGCCECGEEFEELTC